MYKMCPLQNRKLATKMATHATGKYCLVYKLKLILTHMHQDFLK